MSQENLKEVRTPVTVSTEGRRRTLDERILIQFPGLVSISGVAWSRLPRRGLVIRQDDFADRDEALKAAGLRN